MRNNLRILQQSQTRCDWIIHIGTNIQRVQTAETSRMQIEQKVKVGDDAIEEATAKHLASGSSLFAREETVQILSVLVAALVAQVARWIGDRHGDQGTAELLQIDIVKETEDERNTVQLVAVQRSRETKGRTETSPLGHDHRQVHILTTGVTEQRHPDTGDLAVRQAGQILLQSLVRSEHGHRFQFGRLLVLVLAFASGLTARCITTNGELGIRAKRTQRARHVRRELTPVTTRGLSARCDLGAGHLVLFQTQAGGARGEHQQIQLTVPHIQGATSVELALVDPTKHE
mmetsp:Transcript_34740/g.87354  ORF Transcript_34740/g.87354 Transcript_34740/m.87354 type:complete len:288 (-) Transcript_34740:908-1771(-)